MQADGDTSSNGRIMTNSKHDQASSSTGEMTDSEPGQPKNPTDSAIEMLADDSGTASNPPSDGTELTMATLLQQLAEAENKALRYQADLENYRRRAKTRIGRPTQVFQLELGQRLTRCVRQSPSSCRDGTSGRGCCQPVGRRAKVFTQLEEILSKHGIRRIQSEGRHSIRIVTRRFRS
jgi:hypothetical protein